MKKRVIALLISIVVLIGLGVFVNQAKADPGPNYVASATSDWVTAGDTDNPNHVISTAWDPSTDYWKIEVRTNCPDGTSTSEGVDVVIRKSFSGATWQYFSTGDSGIYNDGIDYHPYPGGEGVTGFHTPDFSGPFYFTIDTPQWFAEGTDRCVFKLVTYNHV